MPDHERDEVARQAKIVGWLIGTLRRVKIELRGTTAQGGDAECLIDSALREADVERYVPRDPTTKPHAHHTTPRLRH
jgi:hypothetical protein